MKNNWKYAFMDATKRFAQESYATRLKVGASVVKDDRIISIGINGMPSGWDNECETRDYMPGSAGGWLHPTEIEERWPFKDDDGKLYALKTKPEVLHAESNCLSKLAKTNESGDDAAIFVTHSPCIHCAKMIYQAGIKEVYYATEYRDSAGIEFLQKCNIVVEHID